MRTTVKELLGILVGRNPDEIIEISNGELRVTATINLLNTPATGVQMVQDAIVDIKKPTVNPPAKSISVPKVKNGNRAWKPADLKMMADLRAKGASFDAIGEVFGRTGKAIECQLNYLRNGRPQKESRSVALL